jgi:predicted nucleic acid-binding protein
MRAGAVFVLSILVHFEVTRYLQLRGARQIQRAYQGLVAGWPLVELSTADWDMAAGLWATRHRAGRPIEDADLLIAVTALKSGATLVTNNTRHYEGLGLTLENWMSPLAG